MQPDSNKQIDSPLGLDSVLEIAEVAVNQMNQEQDLSLRINFKSVCKNSVGLVLAIMMMLMMNSMFDAMHRASTVCHNLYYALDIDHLVASCQEPYEIV